MADETLIQTTNILVFGKYGLGDIVIKDGGLAKYISLNPVMVPHSTAKHANRWFGKSKVNIVERLMNNMMRTEVFTGKKMKTYRVVKDAFVIIETKTKKNPVQVLVEALENAAPREEITRLQFGGISVPKAVDISPSRRLDIALRNISKGAIAASFKNTKSIEQCLADELIFASKNDMNSFAVSKKEEAERVAQSAR
jgi:small subunit ribosomal protein S7